MKSFDYTTAKFSCPQCRKPLDYAGYTAFSCKQCKRGFTIRRHLTFPELEEKNKPVPMYEDPWL
ncbi:hypothetical protein LCGC14_1620460 [marine sediment metagenome]|uniref:Uncharacterized protein n=1 Tax=marine sediment metagenome TaxID=412755 RepID=A0A0F9ISI3_9ZZZZ|nr:hypothetical protein [bacterium]